MSLSEFYVSSDGGHDVTITKYVRQYRKDEKKIAREEDSEGRKGTFKEGTNPNGQDSLFEEMEQGGRRQGTIQEQGEGPAQAREAPQEGCKQEDGLRHAGGCAAC